MHTCTQNLKHDAFHRSNTHSVSRAAIQFNALHPFNRLSKILTEKTVK